MTRPTAADLRHVVEGLFDGGDAGATGRVGVELELLPTCPDPQHALSRAVAGLHVAGRVTFEPGGQVEYGSTPCASLAELVEETAGALRAIESAATDSGVPLAARGLAPWRGPEETGLVNPTARYRAMDRYFASRGPWGAWMMRLTASLQVNLDLGPPEIAIRRWHVANGLAPVLVAAFANSPADLPDGTPTPAGRSWVWRQLDASRTGVLGRPEAADAPWAEYLAFALSAPVMFDHRARPVAEKPREAPRFADWWAGRVHGDRPPDIDDWRSHLTTLFPEVRPRGWLEIRSVDVPRRPYWSVPAAVLASVLYDDRALTAVEDMLAARSEPTSAALDRAIAYGPGDPRLAEESRRLFGLAREAMGRQPTGWTGAPAERAVAEFEERYVVPGRTQSDDGRAAGEVARLAVTEPAAAADRSPDVRAASLLPGSS